MPEDRRIVPAPASAPVRDDGLATFGWISYILHLIVALTAVIPGAQGSITLLLIALVLDLVKRQDAAGTWHASHFRWRLHSVFWHASHFRWRLHSVFWCGALYLLTSWLWLIFFIPGWIAWTLISVWFLYRIVLGMVRMNRRQPMDAAG